MGDILGRSLHGHLPPMFHKVVCSQFPDVVSEIDGKTDAGQNGNLKQAQSLENGSKRPHSTHKTHRHPERAVPLAERYALMGSSGHGNGRHPDEQRGNNSQSHEIKDAEKLQHQFRSLRTAKPLPPGIPALPQKGIKNLFAAVRFQQDFRSSGNVRSGHRSRPRQV